MEPNVKGWTEEAILREIVSLTDLHTYTLAGASRLFDRVSVLAQELQSRRPVPPVARHEAGPYLPLLEDQVARSNGAVMCVQCGRSEWALESERMGPGSRTFVSVLVHPFNHEFQHPVDERDDETIRMLGYDRE